MFATQHLGRRVHPARVQRRAAPTHAARFQRRPDPAIQNQVTVTARECAEPCVERRFDGPDPQHADTAGQVAVGAQQPVAFGALRVGVEMGDLPECMDPGIRSAAAGHPHLVGSDLRERPLDATLHGRLLALDLPAQELAAVVFKPNRIPHRQVTQRGPGSDRKRPRKRPGKNKGRGRLAPRPRTRPDFPMASSKGLASSALRPAAARCHYR